MSQEIHISVNKRRLLIQAIVFTILAFSVLFGFFVLAEKYDSWGYVWKTLGVVIALFTLIAAGAKLKKRSEREAGLTISKEGIRDASSELSLGMISWGDIQQIDREESLKNDLLIIRVKKNQAYLKKAKNQAIERLLKQNIDQFGTPVVVDPVSLSLKLEEIIAHIDSFESVK
ncbi:MAG: STM3941 family protein [Crocinitomicaceae bacterium]